MTNVENVMKDVCTGCTACKNSCPVNAISMIEDKEGFLYPKIDKSKCINCGLCYKMCPGVKKNSLNNIKSSFVAKNKKCSIYSTSGGIFPIIANFILKRDGYICGAVINENNEIEHVVTNNEDIVNKMRGSKYVQSDLKNSFKQIKSYLDNNHWCLFVGTPCQVSGLRSFLRKDYKKLLCVDLICHGVPSQKILKKCIDAYGNYKLIGFREKNKFEGSTYKITLEKNGKLIKKYYYEDPYFNLFMNGSSLRESCYNCIYATSKRIGDITIGDSSCYREYKEFLYEDAVSLILINTDKGEKAWELIKDEMLYVNANQDKEIKNNRQLNEPTKRDKKRDEVYSDLDKLSIVEFQSKYTNKLSKKKLVIREIKKLIPTKIKRFIKKG